MASFCVLDVRHGNCSILFDNDVTTIFDAGPGTRIINYLKKQKIKQINTVLISHADKDHIGGLNAILSADIKIDKLFINADSTKDSLSWNDLIYDLSRKDNNNEINFQPYLSVDLNDSISNGKIKIEILAPSKYLIAKGVGSVDSNGKKITSNTISAVIKLSLIDKSLILLTGDIDQTGLDNLIAADKDISANTVIFPHHGGGVGSKNIMRFTQIICEKVNPQHVIFSIKENDSSYPRLEVLKTISNICPSSVMYTTNFSTVFEMHIESRKNHKNDVGTIHIDLEKSPIEFEFERG